MTAQQLTDKVFALPPEARQHAEEFIDYLQHKYVPTTPTQAPPVSRVRGVPGRELLRFAGTIEPDDLILMQQAIEEDCERIDSDGW